MTLKNKLNLTNSAQLRREEEIMTKKKAKQLFDSGDIDKIEVGTFKGSVIYMTLQDRFVTLILRMMIFVLCQ